MWCPKCGTCKTLVHDSRITDDNVVVRRRYCPNCRKKVYTTEIVSEESPEKMQNKLRMIWSNLYYKKKEGESDCPHKK